MQKRSLGFKMVAGGIMIVLIPLLVVGMFSALRSSKALEEAAKGQAAHIAQNLAGMTQLMVLEEMKLISEISANTIVVDAATRAASGMERASGGSERLGIELADIMKKIGKDYEVILAADLNGTIYADSVGGSYKGIAIADRDYFKEAKGGKAYAGQPVKSKKTGNPIVPFSAPVYSRTGEITGVVATVMKTDFLIEKIASIKIGDSGYPWMVDRNGVVIAHPKKEYLLALDLTKEAGMQSIMSKMLAHQSGVDDYVFKGVRKIAGFAPVPVSGWSIGVTQNADEFLSASRHIRNFILITGTVFLCLTILSVLYFSRGMIRPVTKCAESITDAADQVASASGQVATASQSLAEGASASASSIEETSASLEEMSSMTSHNAENANQAKALMSLATQIVDRVDRHMKEMTAAIEEITTSSKETGKIIKTIDEIAFQTNLLALNAAVEAARAGEAGAGFAVVADEVRNLAIRAAEAAKNTSHLIENTIKSVRSGNELTRLTQEAFKENIEIAGKVGRLVDEIAAASHEQAQGVNQITKAVTEMDKVTQQNAANAEESASACEEMSAQAAQMKKIAGKLMNLMSGTNGSSGNGKPDFASPGIEESRKGVHRAPAFATAGKIPAPGSVSGHEVRPGDILPLDDTDFKSF